MPPETTIYTVAEEWLQLADEQDKVCETRTRGRVRSNSFDISAIPESIQSSVLLSPEEALYYHSKDILSQPPLSTTLSTTTTTCYSRNELSMRGEEDAFRRSDEYKTICMSNKPTLRIVFLGGQDNQRNELLRGMESCHLTSHAGQVKTDYYHLVASEKSLSFNLIFCNVHSDCSIPIQQVMMKTCQLLACVIDLTSPDCCDHLNLLLEQVKQKAEGKKVCVIGIRHKCDHPLSENVIRSRLQTDISFMYYEACVDNKKVMKRVQDNISHSVIQSQL